MRLIDRNALIFCNNETESVLTRRHDDDREDMIFIRSTFKASVYVIVTSRTRSVGSLKIQAEKGIVRAKKKTQALTSNRIHWSN